MKIRRRLWIYSCIIIAGLCIFFAYRYIGTRLWGLQFPWNSFLFFEQDRFMDFYKVNELVSSFNPYSNGSSYPPLALLCAYLFARIIPRTGTESAFALRDCSVIGRICLYSLYAVCLLLIFISVWKHMRPLLKKENAIELPFPSKTGMKLFFSAISKMAIYVAVALSITLSAPMIFAFDRGNYLILCVLFLVLFCLNFGRNDYAAALFLAFAACLKIFPLVLFFVFIPSRKWKPLVLGLFSGVGITILCTLLFDGGLVSNLWRFAKSVGRFTGGLDANNSYYYRYAVGIRSIFGTISIILRSYVSPKIHITVLTLASSALLLLLISVMCIMEKRVWRQILYLSFFMVLFPTPSYYYNLAYLIGPILLFLLKEEKEKLDWLYLVGLALLMIPKSYYYFLAHFSDGNGWVGLDSLLDPMFMCILLAISFVELIYMRKKRTESIAMGKKKEMVVI